MQESPQTQVFVFSFFLLNKLEPKDVDDHLLWAVFTGTIFTVANSSLFTITHLQFQGNFVSDWIKKITLIVNLDHNKFDDDFTQKLIFCHFIFSTKFKEIDWTNFSCFKKTFKNKFSVLPQENSHKQF